MYTYEWFHIDRDTPNSIWITPSMMDIFILNAFWNIILLSASCKLHNHYKNSWLFYKYEH